jgi:broad specificity phosphatase PhoE
MKNLIIRFILPALLLCELASAQSRTIFLVRHAEAESSAAAAALTPAGERRAQCLADTLNDAAIKQIFVSDAKRSQQTAAPIAARLKMSPSTVAAKDVSTLVRNLLYGTGGNVLVVAQADTLPVLVQRLQGGSISAVGDNEFDRLFVVTVMEGAGTPVTSLRYCDAGAPSAPATHTAVASGGAGQRRSR